MEDRSAEPYIDPEEELLWRSSPEERLREIKDPQPNRWGFIAFHLYLLVCAAVPAFLTFVFSALEFSGHFIIASAFAAIAVAVTLYALASLGNGIVNWPSPPIAHAEYLLTSHRLVVVRENGTSMSIYPEAVTAIESDRLPVGYHVVLHVLTGDGPFQHPIALSRFRIGAAEDLEKRIIAWKNAARGQEFYEQAH
ncbi:MAG: hypothetical protein AAGJ68_15535 [Pseudomonadota bacterium]